MKYQTCLLLFAFQSLRIIKTIAFIKLHQHANPNIKDLSEKTRLPRTRESRSPTEVKFPALIEYPVNYENSWEEGEIPWVIFNNETEAIAPCDKEKCECECECECEL